MQDAYIIDGVRTPIGSFGGTLSAIRADDLAALPIIELLKRQSNLDPALIDEVILGCANQAGEDNRNVARMALLLAGLPVTVAGETVNRLCASGLSAVAQAARAIKVGEGDVMIAGGMEHMTRAPYVMSKSAKPFGTDSKLFDSSFGWRFVNPKMEAMYGVEAMGQTAENLAEMMQISRADQDLFAVRSQEKAFVAQHAGFFQDEVMVVEIEDRRGVVTMFNEDEFTKPQSSIEGLARLKPAFKKDGTVTAGNASGLNDGAAALLIVSGKKVAEWGLKPLARVVASAATGVEPRIMGIGPVSATRLVLQRAGLQLKDMDHIELNEAFAAQSLACLRQLGIDDDDPRVNPHGGAIALGHPLGMSGARIALSAARSLQINGGRYALVTMCIGVGQGFAMIIERS